MIPLKDTIPSRHFPIVNFLIIMVNVWAFFIEVSLGPAIQNFLQVYGFVPAHFTHPAAFGMDPFFGRIIPIFTAMFLHGGWLHIIGNMWFLWIFGDNVEDAMGHGRYLIFYLLCGVAATMTQYAVNPASTIPNIGASGAIAGVMAAYLLMYPRAKILTLLIIIIFIDIIEIPAFIFILFWFALQLVYGLVALPAAHMATGGVAYFAHIGGFATGLILVWFFKEKRRPAFVDEYLPW
ncbi:MAG: rhomboid family intramembrane serine protease [Calditrichaeota bacterium]|nr:rhomboid family intramembrane serine protease [Calditrichota bacterium]